MTTHEGQTHRVYGEGGDAVTELVAQPIGEGEHHVMIADGGADVV